MEKAIGTHPLISPLCEKIKGWRSENGLETHSHLEDGVRAALDKAKKVKIEEGLVIYVIARCEYWFRICFPSKQEIELALSDLLQSPRYTPHCALIDKGPGISRAIQQHIDRSLSKEWDPDASEEMNRLIRRSLLEQADKIAESICYPFLVSDHLQLPPKKGGYTDWAPWVAANVVYRTAMRATRQDPEPRMAAEAVVLAMRGTEPDKSAFHLKMREIRDRAPGLFIALHEGYKNTKKMNVQVGVQPLIDEFCFPALGKQGGWSLLVGGTK